MGQPAPLPAENQLLIAASRLDESDPSFAASVIDWDYVQRAASRQGVAPLLYRWLQRHPDCRPDPAFTDALHDAYWRGHFRNRLLFDELQRIGHLAASRGIAIMPMKGGLLAREYYDAPALRPLSDLDLLIQPKDIAALGSLLQSQGYVETDQSPSYVDDENLDLDSRDYCWFASREGFDAFIEYRVAPLELAVARLTDLDAAYTEALRQHARDVWARATPTGDGSLLRQTPEDLLLHVATHLAAKHLDFRLIWLHDLALIVRRPDLDWTYVVDQSVKLRMAAPVAAALEAARTYVGAPVDERHIARLTGSMGAPSRLSLQHRDLARLRQHVASLPSRDLTGDGPWGWPLVAALSRVNGWQARLRILRWVLLPGRGYLEHRGTSSGGPVSRIAGSLKRLVLRARRGSHDSAR